MIGCSICGWVPECPSCSTTMTYHSVNERAICHFCGASMKMTGQCPQCHAAHLFTECAGTPEGGGGTAYPLPAARVLRMDADTTSRKNAHTHLMEVFGAGRADILIGTQMVAKGLDFDG